MWTRLAVVGALLVAGSCALHDGPAKTPRADTAATTGPTVPGVPVSQPPSSAAAGGVLRGLLLPAPGGDGDSWRDTQGREYRLGLVNTPETDECFGAEATAERSALTATGFSVDVYAQDRYGRSVAVVRLADGRDLNVHLARYGFADDRYLARFRDEDPQLAVRLDAAFAAARAERRGLWGACARTDA